MKPYALVSTACLVIILAACSPQDKPEMNSGDLPGSYRDAHNCIPSAGYQWSEVLEDCIRLFERGTALLDMQDPDSTSYGYIVKSPDGDRLELFSTGDGSTLLSLTAENEWRDADGKYLIRLEPPSMFTVYNKDGEAIYYEDRGDADIVPDTSEDDDLLTEIGIISMIEDGAYPFYSANVEFPKREMTIGFTLNIEELGISPQALLAMEGKYVSFDYTSDLEKMVAEMELESGFLMGTENPADLRDLKSARGIMGGAEVTMGDLPGTFYLEDAEGGRDYFEEFINNEMMAGLGRDVIVYYDVRARNHIKKISLMKD